MIFAEDRELFPVDRAAGCLRYDIGTCLGPCLGACTRRQYYGRVRAAQNFLAGVKLTILDTLKNQMRAAAARQQFERAASLRDKLESLSWIKERLNYLREVRERQSFVYQVRGHTGTTVWYVIQHGYVVAACPAPSDELGRSVLRTALERVLERQPTRAGPVPAAEIDGVLLVAAWFRRHPEERASTIALRQALALC
jgi:excinuclease ABC subunit C